jgi:hypothetical protein
MNRRLISQLPFAGALQEKHMEVRGERLGVKLPQHECNLTSMVSGMVR